MNRPYSRLFPLLLAAACAGPMLAPAARSADQAPPKPADRAPQGASAADYGVESTPPEIQSALEEAMVAKVKTLLDEKNGDGVPFKRGSFSRRFRKIDDNT